MTTTWVLVANAAQASLYQSPKAKLFNNPDKLTLVDNYIHPESRLSGAELKTDRAGNYKSGTSGHGSFVEQSNPREHEADVFAKDLAVLLNKGRVDNSFQDLILIAPASFCGMINKHLDCHVQELVSSNIHKDFTKFEDKELIKHIQTHL